MTRQQKIANLPQETKQYLISQYKEIEQCNSSGLLEYSRKLHKQSLDTFVMSLLFEAVDARQKNINAGLDKKNECFLAKKVKNFKRGV